MAHITEFRIEGLAGREKAYRQILNRDVNVFFGLNGAGKTSLLRILHSAMARDASLLEGVPFTSAEVHIYSIDYDRVFVHRLKNPAKSRKRRGRKTVSISTGYSHTVLGDDIVATPDQLVLAGSQAGTEWKITPPLRGDTSSWRHSWLPTSRLYLGRDVRGSRPAERFGPALSESVLDKQYADAMTAIWTQYSVRVVSAVAKAQEQGLASILKAVLAIGPNPKKIPTIPPDKAYQRLRAFLQRQNSESILASPEDFAQLYQRNPQLASVVSDIDRTERKIEKATALRNKLEEMIRSMFSGQKRIEFTDREIRVVTTKNEDIGLRSLSSGEKQALRMFAEALIDPDNSILIDEPEISLHLDWQKRLIGSMRQLSPKAQLILATHSPEILADIPDKKIFRL